MRYLCPTSQIIISPRRRVVFTYEQTQSVTLNFGNLSLILTSSFKVLKIIYAFGVSHTFLAHDMPISIKILFSSDYGSSVGEVATLKASQMPTFVTADGIDGRVIVSGCNDEDFDHVKIVLQGWSHASVSRPQG